MAGAVGDGAIDAEGFNDGVTDGPFETEGLTKDGAFEVEGDSDAVMVGLLDDVTVGDDDGISDANREGGSEGVGDGTLSTTGELSADELASCPSSLVSIPLTDLAASNPPQVAAAIKATNARHAN